MKGRCYGNPAQYERNRRFRHLVHVSGWTASGAKLPSDRLWLNASKSESGPECNDIVIDWLLGGKAICPDHFGLMQPVLKWRVQVSDYHHINVIDLKSFVDDLNKEMGVVRLRVALRCDRLRLSLILSQICPLQTDTSSCIRAWNWASASLQQVRGGKVQRLLKNKNFQSPKG